MVAILFSPFDLGKWFVLGFSAWLAVLGEGGGSFSFPSEMFEGEATQFFREHLLIIITVFSLVMIVALAIGLVLVWINSRGKFMFLDNVVHDRRNVAEPWHRFRQLGNSLFLWQIIFGLVSMFLVLLVCGLGVLTAWPKIHGGSFGAANIAGLAGVIVLFIVVLIAISYVYSFLYGFVIPIMYKRDLPARAAWRVFLNLFKQNVLGFILYSMFMFVIGAGIGVLVMMLCVVTCCCGLVLLMMPYVNAVLLLPVHAFTRLFSLEFLAQFGPEYDVFPRTEEPATPPLPPAGESV